LGNWLYELAVDLHRDNYIYVEHNNHKMDGKSHDLEITILEHALIMLWHIACRSRSCGMGINFVECSSTHTNHIKEHDVN
jgi:hypothetical protein